VRGRIAAVIVGVWGVVPACGHESLPATAAADSDAGSDTDSAADSDSGSGSDSGSDSASEPDVPLVPAAAPTFAPPPGNFFCGFVPPVTMATTTPNAHILYTTDGTNPTPTSTVYSSPVPVFQTTTLRARTAAPGYADSTVTVGTYVLFAGPCQCVPPAPNPIGGTFANDVSVTLTTTTGGATICYTLDGSTPTCTTGACQGTTSKYTVGSPVPITATGTTVNALACKAGLTDATMPAQLYKLTAAPATFAPPSGTASPTSITLTTGTQNGVIHYTTDGTPATCASPSTVTTSGTLNAGQYPAEAFTMSTIVCKAGYTSSSVATASYN
jgi:hypothetical protein